MANPNTYLLAGLLPFLLIDNALAQTPAPPASGQRPQSAQPLSTAQQAIVEMAAFTARGDQSRLQTALRRGLNSGLSIAEINEVLVQLYAYAGFPRSLNALSSFVEVLSERKQRGIADAPGKAPSPLPANKSKRQLGAELQTRLVGTPVRGAVYDFSPTIDEFLKEHLFADVFGRDNLDWTTRELATIAALASLGNVENQLRGHFGVGLRNGLTEGQLEHVVAIVQTSIGAKEGNAAGAVLSTVLKKPQPTVAAAEEAALFPRGEPITNNNFTGRAWLHAIATTDSLNPSQVGNVTFEPGARTNWHSHPGGQILLITEGTGYYQERGQAKRIIRRGDSLPGQRTPLARSKQRHPVDSTCHHQRAAGAGRLAATGHG